MGGVEGWSEKEKGLVDTDSSVVIMGEEGIWGTKWWWKTYNKFFLKKKIAECDAQHKGGGPGESTLRRVRDHLPLSKPLQLPPRQFCLPTH